MISHNLAEPPIFSWLGLDPKSGITGTIQAMYWRFFYTGSAGVIVFFIISGFCIHFPHTDQLRVPRLGSYFTRRLLRIIPPALPVLFYYHLVDKMSLVNAATSTLLWSVVCEVIYYMLYPILLMARRRLDSWWPLIVISYLAGICVVLTNPSSHSYWSYGPTTTWIIGLPCWLLGAALAEGCRNGSKLRDSVTSIWVWRSATWSLAAFCVILNFRTPVGDPWTLNLFGFFAFFWLRREIENFKNFPPNRWLEAFGTWSYSLYVTHMIVWVYLEKSFSLARPLSPFTYLGSIIVILGAAYAYFRLIELPSHYFSRFASKWICNFSIARKT